MSQVQPQTTQISSPAPTPPQQPYHPYQPTTSSGVHIPPGKLSIHSKDQIPWRAIGKLSFAIVFLILMVTSSVILGPKIFKPSVAGDENILLATSYKPVLWKDFGNVFEPEIKIPVQYPVEGFQDVDFLLDSGAVVSSLPRDEAKKLGLSLAKLPRSTFSGFGGTLSFAYRGKITVLLGTEEFVIPVVFTEAAGTKPLLGRSGFFEQFSVYFNHEAKQIQIKK
jgi:hypothetical protein